MKPLTFSEFIRNYSDNDVCLDIIFNLRYANLEACPGCGIVKPRFYRIKSRKCYECGDCSYQIYPTAGTIMEGSTTSLSTWFYAIYMFSISKNGVSAKELQRSLGVTYKTAWRMGHKIRELMKDDPRQMLSGTVEIDETLIGGRRSGKRGWGADNKICLLGMIERNGRVKVVKIENRKREVIVPIINETVEKGSIINTDEYKVYKILENEGYSHKTVVHSKYQWSREDAYTNSMEGYWSNLKKSIFGTHTYVSPKHLQKYLDEFSFRHNSRRKEMFSEIIKRIKMS